MKHLPINTSLRSLYRQARVLASPLGGHLGNRGWYRRADQQAVQWHLFVSGGLVVSRIRELASDRWLEGPHLPDLSLVTDEGETSPRLSPASRESLQGLVRDLIQPYRGARDSGLGVVLHLSESFHIRKLAAEFETETELADLDELLILAPEKALGDRSVATEASAWRLLPLAADDSELTGNWFGASISDRFRCFVDELRGFGNSLGYPIAAEARSAALEMLLHAPLVGNAPVDSEKGNILVVVRYPKQTVYAVLRRNGNPEIIRVLPKPTLHGQEAADLSDLLRSVIATGNVPVSQLFFVDRFPPEDGAPDFGPVTNSFPGITVESISLGAFPNSVGFAEGIPEAGSPRAEADDGVSVRIAGPLAEAALLDFYSAPHSEAARLPRRADLLLARTSLYFRSSLFFFLLIASLVLGMDVFRDVKSTEWSSSPEAVTEANALLTGLMNEKKRWQAWDDILSNRSEGWLALELPLRLFPEKSGLLLQDFSFRLEAPVIANNRVGYTRRWRLSGYVDPEIVTNIASLGSEREVTGVLKQIASENEAPYLSEGLESSLELTFQQRQASMPESSHFPLQFTRRFRNAFDLSLGDRVTPDRVGSLPTLPRVTN
jgi:hypothetical protein